MKYTTICYWPDCGKSYKFWKDLCLSMLEFRCVWRSPSEIGRPSPSTRLCYHIYGWLQYNVTCIETIWWSIDLWLKYLSDHIETYEAIENITQLRILIPGKLLLLLIWLYDLSQHIPVFGSLTGATFNPCLYCLSLSRKCKWSYMC